MDHNQFLENFIAAVDFEEPVPMDLTTELASLKEWDSLAALGVIVMADLEYSVSVTGQDLKSCVTIGDIAAIIERKQG